MREILLQQVESVKAELIERYPQFEPKCGACHDLW